MSKNKNIDINSNNRTIDLGNLMIIDTSSLTNEKNPEITETIMLNHAKENLKLLQTHLFRLLNEQKGENDENRDYSKDESMIKLPKPILNLPRSMSIPKPKPLTKWEKFKKEKGIVQKKRSRMIYSDIAKDWVPRWGKGSAKKIEDEANWAIEDDGTGENPFDKKRAEKQLQKAKQDKRQLKNELNALKNSKNDNDNNIVSKPKKKEKKALKFQKEINKLEQDKKNLGKRLEDVQKSTRSMGHFDKKLKNEKELNMIKKKKVSKDILLNRKRERSRDKMIMDGILNKK